METTSADPRQPETYDVVFLSTGLVESIVAAALAVAGKRVLQIDQNDQYGSSWRTVSPDQISSRVRPSAALTSATASKIHVDLNPRLAYADGPLVSLLLASGAHNYAEFVFCKTAVWSELKSGESGATGAFVGVAASKGDVFKDSSLSLVQKNALVRALKELAERPERPWREISDDVGLDADLVDRFVHGVCLSNGVDKVDGIAGGLLTTYGRSLGKYVLSGGSSPFLYPKYGCSELCSAFSRRAAVAGAVQMLRCKARVRMAKGGSVGVGDQDGDGDGKEVVFEPSEGEEVVFEQSEGEEQPLPPVPPTSPSHKSLPPSHLDVLVRDEEGVERRIAASVVVGRGRRAQHTTTRCCALVRGRAIPRDGRCLAAFPRASSDGNVVWMLQLDCASGCCDLEGHTLVHLWTTREGNQDQSDLGNGVGVGSPEDEFRAILERHVDCSLVWDRGVGGGVNEQRGVVQRPVVHPQRPVHTHSRPYPRIEALWAWCDDDHYVTTDEGITVHENAINRIITDYDGDLAGGGLVSFAGVQAEAERLFLLATRELDELVFPFSEAALDNDNEDDELDGLEDLLMMGDTR